MHTDKDRLSEARLQLLHFNLAGFGVPLAALLLVVSYLAYTGTELARADVKHLVGTLWLGGIVALSAMFVRAIWNRPTRRGDSAAAISSRPAEAFQRESSYPSLTEFFAPILIIPTLVLLAVEAWNLYYGNQFRQADWKMIVLITWVGTLLVVFAKILRTAFRPR